MDVDGQVVNPMMEFQAVVTDIREERRIAGRSRWQMQLDKTEFGEGDTGVLEAVARSGALLEVPVLSTVVDVDGDMWHVVDKPMATGTQVTGRVKRKEV